MLTRSLLLITCLAFNWVFAATIEGARVWPSPDNTRLVFDLDRTAEHAIFTLKNPYRIVLDLDNASLTANLDELDLTETGIRQIRSAERNGSDLRIVLDMSENMSPKSFALPPNEQYGHRLVVDLERLLFETDTAIAQPQATVSMSIDDVVSQRRDIIVAIDAGHGGEDPGAIGPSGLREKNVVLAIAREVFASLEAQPGYQPMMVRTGDYIVPLQERYNFARKNNADLFISIHADAFHDASANGASVFALSNGGSVSAVAKYLADQENAADVIGGINGVSLEDKDDTLRSVLVDLSMTATLQRSLSVGEIVLNEMGKFAKLHGNRRRVDQANFVVLRAPDVPSILVETGFISNPREERNLGSRAYRQKMANAIKDGVVQYFEQSPPDGTWLAWQQQERSVLRRYTVIRGDTLSTIASRNGVTVNQLKAMNNLTSNTIRIGQILLIPGV